MSSHVRTAAVEGDLVKDCNNIIFDVKGQVHPPDKIVAFPRFIPESSGNRTQQGIAYAKVYALSERFKFLENNLPQYIVHDVVFDEKLCEVPRENVRKHYRPQNRLQELRRSSKLDALENCALKFFETINDSSGVSWHGMGISGSLLAKLHTPNSDIDPVVYGTRNCRNVYETLKTLHQNADSAVQPYSTEDLQKLYRFRVQDTRETFEDFLHTESRKVLQGKIDGRDYFVRFVKNLEEIQEQYGAVRYRNVGYAKIKAAVGDDSESIFTPCSYRLINVQTLDGSRFPIEEIVSFRGRFCEQARNGEAVVAQGKVEHVTDTRQNCEHFRLLLGNKPSDFMALA